MRKMGVVFALLSMIFLASATEKAVAGFRVLKVDGEPEGDVAYINLIVRGVKVSPIVAHVGDTVRIDVALENRGDPGEETTPLNIQANGKVVASELFSFGWGGEPNKQYHKTFTWNTKGVRPGKYRIEADAFVWDDDSPSDNSLTLKQPLVLLPAGAPAPAGVKIGGAAATIDPRWNEQQAANFTAGAATDIASGY